MTIARFYDESKNPDGAFFPGVPLRDVTDDEWAALSEWLQASADAHPMYRKTPVPAPKAAKE